MKAVLLVTYGTPRSLEEVEAYYTHIRGGQKPTEAQLAELKERYKAIGGVSPLVRITESQANKLQGALDRRGSTTSVYCGMKHSSPFVAEAMEKASEDGATEMLVIPMSPHYSKFNTETYVVAAEGANSRLRAPLRLDFVRSWNKNPLLLDAWAARLRAALGGAPPETSVVFSAHSLPESTLAQGDTYRSNLLETAGLVASKAEVPQWTFAFQSAGRTREPWLGPDILEHLQQLFDGGSRNFLVAPIGFVADHLEVLYDIDVECRRWAEERGASLKRCEMPNDSDDFVACLDSIVAERGFA